MALTKKYAKAVKEIQKTYGRVIDLERSPSVIIEILRKYAHIIDDNGGGGSGGVSPGVSTIAVGVTPQNEHVENELILQAVLRLQKEIRLIGKQLDRLVPGN